MYISCRAESYACGHEVHACQTAWAMLLYDQRYHNQSSLVMGVGVPAAQLPSGCFRGQRKLTCPPVLTLCKMPAH